MTQDDINAKARLVRIMGTFDLATGHGDTMDELLDSLESELRDVLGHYREALKQRQPLTDEQIHGCIKGMFKSGDPWLSFARAIEKAHEIKE